jgi:hypothetical protein
MVAGQAERDFDIRAGIFSDDKTNKTKNVCELGHDGRGQSKQQCWIMIWVWARDTYDSQMVVKHASK